MIHIAWGRQRWWVGEGDHSMGEKVRKKSEREALRIGSDDAANLISV
jgi:hypothetical protein